MNEAKYSLLQHLLVHQFYQLNYLFQLKIQHASIFLFVHVKMPVYILDFSRFLANYLAGLDLATVYFLFLYFPFTIPPSRLLSVII